jgi:carboxypeptidase Taq
VLAMAHSQFEELKSLLREVHDINSAAAVLNWDQQTYMPAGGATTRGRQLATLQKIAHEKFTDPAIGRMLDALEKHVASLDPDSDEAALIRVTRRDYEKAIKVPPAFTAALAEHQSETYVAWTKARPANDFRAVAPRLERTLELSRQLADYFPGYEHIADPLIDYADEGMKASDVRRLFTELRAKLVPLVKSIIAQPLADDACLRQSFPETKQIEFAAGIVKRFGYDFNRGRLDKTHHPFCTTFSLGDVRITTRVKENNLGDALFSIFHEGGHALYEQNITRELEGTPLATGTSSGVHESQSRTWENVVGRSRAFWEFAYPELQRVFPQQLNAISLDAFYRAINKVEPSLIRTDADEVTYNLHVMIRFDFELQLLEGKLAIKDLPEAWHARYQSDFGIRAPDDRDGVLQDVHWYGGIIGGVFQGYTLGNIMSAQFYDAALRARPEIPKEIARGEFGTLRNWLTENIYRHGRKFTADQIIDRATEKPLGVDSYIDYLQRKYGDLYPGISLGQRQ